jgi:hypothetical protein
MSRRLAVAAALLLAAVGCGTEPEPVGEAALRQGWKAAGDLARQRAEHTATRLADGRVLVAGGYGSTGYGTGTQVRYSAELYDPATRGFTLVLAGMVAHRAGHTATLLGGGSASAGRVLLVGGYDDVAGALDTAELYDPAASPEDPEAPSFSAVTGTMTSARRRHTATRLGDGPEARVLVAGGLDPAGAALDTAEVYDPTTRSFVPVAKMTSRRHGHTATRLGDGSILVAGGSDGSQTLASAELYDPTAGTFDPVTAPMTLPRVRHTATLLADQRVLVTGGSDGSAPLASAEVYDPATRAWAIVEVSMREPRMDHTATRLGDDGVLVLGGFGATGTPAIDAAEVFDPSIGGWTLADRMKGPRALHTATLLDDGSVLAAGGALFPAVTVVSAEVYDATIPSWTPAGSLPAAYGASTLTPLTDGTLLAVGGFLGSPEANAKPSDRADLYDPTANGWKKTAPMLRRRGGHTATLLADGRVLVTGGATPSYTAEVEVYDPSAKTWSAVAPMDVARASHVAVRLLDGRVLVTGGSAAAVDTARIYDPLADRWTPTGAPAHWRSWCTATLLADGRILFAGGDTGSVEGSASAEIYDPDAGRFTPVERMGASRLLHTATRLADGRVLVTGGFQDTVPLDSAEVFDPATGRWTAVASMRVTRAEHTATPLQSGLVIVAGGRANGSAIAGAESFDPATGRWADVAPMRAPRRRHAAAALGDRGLLVTGGEGEGKSGSAEIFDVQPDGTACGDASACRSGFCVEGICCDRACTGGQCEACSVTLGATADGVCTPLHPECAPFVCQPDTGACAEPCRSVADCVEGLACTPSGDCAPPPPDTSFAGYPTCALGAAPRGTAAGVGLAALAAAVLRRRARPRRRGINPDRGRPARAENRRSC